MSKLVKVTHYGTIRIGDIELEAVVLEDGERGYIKRQFLQAIGLHGKNQSHRFLLFLTEIAPNALEIIEKTKYPVVKMPNGANAHFIPAGALSEVVAGVVDSALAGTLHPQRHHLITPCNAIYRALAKTGETALIDEATGYQYHRAPDHLQILFATLLRQTAADWERRFHPEYYEALYRLFGWTYTGAAHKPHVIGRITLECVYEQVLPPEILIEIKERQNGEKLHQWLEDGGIRLVEKQISAVTMVARSSCDYRDFSSRCTFAFSKRGQMPILYPLEQAA